MASNRYNMNDNFEQLLQNEAEDYRAYPSDKVWENIRVEMHGKPKWPALLITFTTIVLALTVATVINYPPHHLLVKENTSIFSNKTFARVSATTAKEVHTVSFVQNKLQVAAPAMIGFIKQNGVIGFDESLAGNDEEAVSETIKQKDLTGTGAISFKNKLNVKEEIDNENDEQIASTETHQNTLSSLKNQSKNQLKKSDDVNKYLNNIKDNKADKKKNQSQWMVQYYAAVSNSYRTLNDDKSRLPFVNGAERQALQSSNVNDVVRQKPAVGGEFGVSFLRKVSKHFFLKAGVQFNIRKYGIDAFNSNGNATFSYVDNNHLNTISIQSAYSTKSGTSNATLQNQLTQISVPIGFQWDIVDGKRWGFSAAATIQPTLTLNKNVYVVSTDYQYYADGTSFFRRLNVNTSTEFFLTLKSKDIKWFFGPQIRYQQMPTFNDIYPIKEHRIDYGIKFGFVKSL